MSLVNLQWEFLSPNEHRESQKANSVSKTDIFIKLPLVILLASSITLACLIAFIIIFQPLILVILLVIQTIPVLLIAASFRESSWLGFVTFLIYLGGLLIIFIYISALVPNQIFMWMGVIMGLAGIIVFVLLNTSLVPTNKFNSEPFALAEFLIENCSNYISIMIIYLLFLLFSISGLTSYIKSPIKSY